MTLRDDPHKLKPLGHATVTVFATGDKIETYSSITMSGNSNGVKLKLFDVEPLGSATDVFKIVITQVNTGDDQFSNGQFVSIYAYPKSDTPEPAIYSNLNPQHDQFQGRASPGEHQILTSPDNIVLDIDGLTPGTVQLGLGLDPPRSAQLDFDSFSTDPPSFPCFVKRTLIETDTGPLPIEALRAGGLVKTANTGLQPLVWTGHATIDGRSDMAPIRFKAGSIGNYQDLHVSTQHCMVRNSWEAELHFGSPEHLVAAKSLVNVAEITVAPRDRVTYYNLLCESHEVIFAEGIATESLHLGDVAVDTLGPTARVEIRALRPDLSWRQTTARPYLKGWEAKVSSVGQPRKIGVLSSAA